MRGYPFREPSVSVKVFKSMIDGGREAHVIPFAGGKPDARKQAQAKARVKDAVVREASPADALKRMEQGGARRVAGAGMFRMPHELRKG